MRSIKSLRLAAIICVVVAAGFSSVALAQPELPCPYEQSAPGTFAFAIPHGVDALTIEAFGGGGGGGGGGAGVPFGGPGGNGGSGGYVSVTQPVSSSSWGQVLMVTVGQGGTGGSGGGWDWPYEMMPPMWIPPAAGTGGGPSSVSGPGWTVTAPGGAGGGLNSVPGANGEGSFEGQLEGEAGAGGELGYSGLPGGDGYVLITYKKRCLGEGQMTVKLVKTDGTEVAGIPVSFSGALSGTIRTDASGVVNLGGLRAGDYAAYASVDGYTGGGPEGATLLTDYSEETVTITLTPVPVAPAEPGPGAIEGTALDGETMAVMPGVLVKLLDSSRTIIGMTITDTAGAFSFDGLEPGSYTVRGSTAGYGVDAQPAVVVNDATTEVSLRLTASLDVPPSVPSGEPVGSTPDLPKTGASPGEMLIVGASLLGAGVFAKRRGF